ncbi:hypothetical protein E8E12_008729 [Didymella heteroderae]|uniref:Uncharacterized protein n=1 Tax=Didymella heteroderae TaxID=1769908 RepID=A0A9P4WRB6_9PLEO|nr:hypothetical protein E8E12_008729 [Didymella heteroderae]
MAAATSATVTVDPPAVKKRGRPRKVVDESAAAPEKPAARKASTKAKAAPKATPKAKTIDALKEKKKTLTKVSDYKTKKATPAPKAAPTEIAEQATPAAPTSSKILDEVKAAGVFSKPPTEPKEPFLPPVPGPAPVAPILPAAAKTPVANTDAVPTPETHYEPPSSASASGAPIQQPVTGAPSKPIIPPTTAAPSERANTIPSKARATTIPLPQTPRTAPSPYSELSKPRVAFAEPAPRAPPRAPRYPQRIIEPTPNTKLPPKYKKAARQVTSIIVGIPIILVVGYELYGRWRTQINTKFEERERRRLEPKPLSVVGEK